MTSLEQPTAARRTQRPNEPMPQVRACNEAPEVLHRWPAVDATVTLCALPGTREDPSRARPARRAAARKCTDCLYLLDLERQLAY